MSVAIWPPELPQPQVASLQLGGPAYCDVIDVLSGPTRTRLTRRNTTGTWEWEVWLSGAQAEAFEIWYADAVEAANGEMYLPWIGNGRVVAFPDEYTMTPIGRAWRLHGLVVQTRIDPTICDAHVCESFGGPVIVDDGVSTELLTADLTAELIIIAGSTTPPCGLIRDHGPVVTDQLIDDGVAEDGVIDDFPLSEFEPC